jgi:hypothetical protein
MVGGAIHRRVIEREISRVLVLNLLWYGKAGASAVRSSMALVVLPKGKS